MTKLYFKAFGLMLLYGVFFTAVKPVFSQNMAAVNQMLNRQNMNQQMMMQMQMMQTGRRLATSLNNEYHFTVILKDSSMKEFNSMIYTDTLLHKNYLLLTDKKFPAEDSLHRNHKIYPAQTLQISRPNSYGQIYGSVTDSCWLFCVIPGKISAYSYLTEKDNLLIPATLIGLQADNGPITSFTAENLKKMVAGNPEALKEAEDKKYVKAINTYNRNYSKKH